MKKKLGVFIVILLIIIAIGCIVYFGFIKNNDDTLEDVSNEEEIIESDETVDWGSIYTIFLLEEEEEEFEIGLFDFNSDDIPELLVKSDDLYKIVYINEEKEAETSSVKDEEIDNLSLVYNNEEQKYYYAYTTIDNEDEINIILDDLTEIPEIIDTSSEEYENDFVIITEDLQEQLEEIIEKDEDKINQAIENAKNYFKTTDEYVKESEVDVESGDTDNVLSDDEAIIEMVDSNLQRERILPSEKAFAYKMKLEAQKHQGQRTDLEETSDQVGRKLETTGKIGKENGDSQTQVKRYIRLTELIPELLELVDKEKDGIAFSPAVELSYLKEDEQYVLLNFIQFNDATPSMAQAKYLKKLSQEGRLTAGKIEEIMGEKKPNQLKIRIKADRIQKLLPKEIITEQQTEEFIIKCIKEHNQRLERKREMIR